MTATAPTAPPPAPTVPRVRQRPPRWLVVAAVTIGLAVLVATMLRPGQPMSMHGDEMDGAVRGTYQLPDGEILTVFGSGRMPRYEQAGRVTMLMAGDADVLESVAGDVTVSVLRDGAGAVTGLRVERAGQPPTFAERVPLHFEQEVRIVSEGAVLAGTVLLPGGPGPHPAVVFAHGAGPHDRYGTFRLLGSHLARRGVAALVYDKRGVGESTGSFTAATFEDLTADTLAAFDVLADHPDVDPARVGVAGFSQSGWTVAQAAQRRDDVAFVVAMSPSGFTPADQQAWLHGSMLAVRGHGSSGKTVADRVSRMLYSSLDLVEAGLMPPVPHVPGFWFHALDPHQETTGVWQGVRQPTLLVWGANDCQVPAHDSMEALGGALRRGGNANVTMAIFEGADHGLTVEGPCVMETQGHHDTHAYADGVLTIAPDWINALPDRLGEVPLAARPDTELLGWHVHPPAPAPWYGTLAAQLAALGLLVGLFGVAAGRGLRASFRRRDGGREAVGWQRHVTASAALAGLAAPLVGFTAFTEIAMLGAVHAAPLVGPGTVDGITPLMTIARLLVSVAAGLGVAASAGVGRPRLSTRWVMAMATTLLIAWAAYWKLLPFA
jgi:uncharacterized protein